MSRERAILCGDVSDAKLPLGDDSPLRLRLWGPSENIHLQVADISEAMLRLHDMAPSVGVPGDVATFNSMRSPESRNVAPSRLRASRSRSTHTW